MQIFVRTQTGKLIILDVESFDTIEKVKTMIQTQRDSTLNLTVHLCDSTHITFKTTSGTVTLEVEGGSNTIQNVRAKIEDDKGIPRDPFMLLFYGHRLEGNKTLADYNIQKEYTLHVRGAMKIFIKSHTGRKYSLEVESSDTIRDVKSMIHDKEGTAVDELRLIYDGRQLEDRWTLAHYYIQEESIIDLVPALRGC